MARTDTEMSKRLPQFVTYVTQRDTHFPTLSVKETLEFAHECSGGELTEREERHFNQGTTEENRAALVAARALYRHYPEVVIQQLGLENCQDTVVGDAMLRGVSGGERKRVTTGEMEFGNRNVLLMDEISTGLDSAATFDIIKTYRSMARRLRKTVVIALLQPSPEVFGLFDDVLLLNKGRVMYNGPRVGVLDYFGGLGLVCPVGRDVADFLVDLGTDRQNQYVVGRVGDGGDGINSATTGVAVMTSPPRSASEFAHAFESSLVFKSLMNELEAPHDPVLLSDIEYHFNSMPEFHQSFWSSTWTLMKRELKVIVRNDALIKVVQS
ncbi:hypothetical protein Poli38472_011123 [Pythium oligandrum]|uniref:ABC transporter family G domain-containing protein n=1 Tax=Pythium oligandrum TaxID=41045 RepID=A0A8K1CR81_PYTOL|nr:hypothetical protein Poli38472_011123 [Pythium oligandrum]|eukprot:TMW67503.1 hypothetical protein Poli38472_011123 [Pythium oligandrum]